MTMALNEETKHVPVFHELRELGSGGDYNRQYANRGITNHKINQSCLCAHEEHCPCRQRNETTEFHHKVQTIQNTQTDFQTNGQRFQNDKPQRNNIHWNFNDERSHSRSNREDNKSKGSCNQMKTKVCSCEQFDPSDITRRVTNYHNSKDDELRRSNSFSLNYSKPIDRFRNGDYSTGNRNDKSGLRTPSKNGDNGRINCSTEQSNGDHGISNEYADMGKLDVIEHQSFLGDTFNSFEYPDEDMFATINNVSAFVTSTGQEKGKDMSTFNPQNIVIVDDIKDKQTTNWQGVMTDLFYNLDNIDLDPVLTENTHDSSSGIASDVASSHNQSATRMSTFKGDNSSVSSADHRCSDSSFDRQFSDSSVSTERRYVKKRQGDGKFPWAYTHGAKVAQQNKSNRERLQTSSDSSVSEYNAPVIHTTPPPSYEYHIQLQKQKNFIHNQFDLQDTEKLMLTSGKGRSKVRPSPFDLMTDDVIVKIFSNLPTDQLCRCSCVCTRWYRLAWDPLLWKKIIINNENVHIDRALKHLTKRLSYNTPTVCVIVEKINLNGCEQLTDKGLHAIAKSCPELRHLEIQGCANVTNAALFEVASYCVNLEYLDVTGCPCVTCIRLTDKLLAQATAPHLRQIYLRYLDMTDCTALDDAGLVSISSYCMQLQYLFLRRCLRIGDQGVQGVCNNCTNLRELSVSDCKRLTDYGASEISKLYENLRYLSVAKCEKVSDVAIIQIARSCKKLRYLNVRGCEAVSDDSLDTIARNLNRLKSLDIGKCDVTDEGLVALAYCSQLRKLSVKSCDGITDLGIVTIAQHCHKMQQLNIQDCHVTLDAYRTVKKHCKRCLIEHTNPGFC